MTTTPPDHEATGIGDCIKCSHVNRLHAKGSTYYLCRRWETDLRYPKYPRLPVVNCPGYEPTLKPPDAKSH